MNWFHSLIQEKGTCKWLALICHSGMCHPTFFSFFLNSKKSNISLVIRKYYKKKEIEKMAKKKKTRTVVGKIPNYTLFSDYAIFLYSNQLFHVLLLFTTRNKPHKNVWWIEGCWVTTLRHCPKTRE